MGEGKKASADAYDSDQCAAATKLGRSVDHAKRRHFALMIELYLCLSQIYDKYTSASKQGLIMGNICTRIYDHMACQD